MMHSTAKRRSILIALICGLILFSCLIVMYSYLTSLNWWTPQVDLDALRERAHREQPIGRGEADTVAFLRSLGFEDRNIRIQRATAPGTSASRLLSIQGWIPQRTRFYFPNQVIASCRFTPGERLEECSFYRSGHPQPNSSEYIIEVTPVPAR